MSFRSSPGVQVNWIDTSRERGFSNFLFVDQQYRSNPVMRRVLSLARKLGYNSLLIDEIKEGDCALLAEENAALRHRSSEYCDSQVHRLSFFRSPADTNPQPADFLGYAVVKTDRFTATPEFRSHVFEAVMPPTRSSIENNFVHCKRVYEVQTSRGKFAVAGVLYAQQNGLTFSCAHVALRSALGTMIGSGDVTYGYLNGLAGIDQRTKTGGDGLEPDQIETILGALQIKFEKLVHEPGLQMLHPNEFQRDLYGIIESGWPALIGFEFQNQTSSPPPRHMIPVIGHTFNEDTWTPDADRAYFGSGSRYYPSENWLSSFLVHDDNFGPYYCVPRALLRRDSARIMYGLKTIATSLTAVEAEAVAFTYANAIVKAFGPRGEDWYDRFAIFARSGWLVVRTQLIGREEYLAHVTTLSDWTGRTLEQDNLTVLRNILPETFWMAEVSAPELFASSRRKFGEFLISATTPRPKPMDWSMLLCARLPSAIVINTRPTLSTEPTELKGHTALFTRGERNDVIAA